ncbi:zf-HC2 domain-containing protein [Actinacidiphila sp. bgisy167]|uniref:zf-HC2 domain-containing protein n=1 Tax=Actinacidiphila sp. bgisy167 TaxID=3413797 RepID=UPI003D71F8C7
MTGSVRGRLRRLPLIRRPDPAAWHVPDAVAAAYADGTLPETTAWSVDKHLEQCAACADRVSTRARTGPHGATLAQVRQVVLAQVASAPVRGAAALPAVRSRPWPAALRSAYAPRAPWMASLLLAVVAAVALTRFVAVPGADPWLLLLAPLLPPTGVALAYGRHADPVYELAASTPSGGLRLLLVRTGVVLAACVPLLTAAGGLLAGAGAAVAWLLPGLTLTAATLVLGSWTGCHRAAAIVATGWVTAVVLCGPPATARNLLFSGAAQQAWAAAGASCVLLLALRRTAFDHMERL